MPGRPGDSLRLRVTTPPSRGWRWGWCSTCCPAAVDDAQAAHDWIVAHHRDLAPARDGGEARLVVAGDSARDNAATMGMLAASARPAGTATPGWASCWLCAWPTEERAR